MSVSESFTPEAHCVGAGRPTGVGVRPKGSPELVDHVLGVLLINLKAVAGRQFKDLGGNRATPVALGLGDFNPTVNLQGFPVFFLHTMFVLWLSPTTMAGRKG